MHILEYVINKFRLSHNREKPLSYWDGDEANQKGSQLHSKLILHRTTDGPTARYFKQKKFSNYKAFFENTFSNKSI